VGDGDGVGVGLGEPEPDGCGAGEDEDGRGVGPVDGDDAPGRGAPGDVDRTDVGTAGLP
jgi:hypothetical protein